MQDFAQFGQGPCLELADPVLGETYLAADRREGGAGIFEIALAHNQCFARWQNGQRPVHRVTEETLFTELSESLFRIRLTAGQGIEPSLVKGDTSPRGHGLVEGLVKSGPYLTIYRAVFDDILLV